MANWRITGCMLTLVLWLIFMNGEKKIIFFKLLKILPPKTDTHILYFHMKTGGKRKKIYT